MADSPEKKVVAGAGTGDNHGDIEDPHSIDVLTVQAP